MKINMKTLKPTIVLGVICLVAALALAGVNMLTKEKVDKMQKEAIAESVSAVMSGVQFDLENPRTLTADESKKYEAEITAIYSSLNEGGETAVVLNTKKGYTGSPITVVVGINGDGSLNKVQVVEKGYPETKGKEEIFLWVSNHFGIASGEKPEEVELVSGVTYSSRAVRNAVIDALAAVKGEAPVYPTGEAAPTGEFGTWSIVGICVLVLAIGGSVSYIIVKRRCGI